MSVTVALAADMASSALTLPPLGVGCEPPLGSSTKMTVSQNAIRKRNRMIPVPIPAAVGRRMDTSLARRLEMAVGEIVGLLPIFDANKPRFFGKFEQPAFDENLRQWPANCQSSRENRPKK